MRSAPHSKPSEGHPAGPETSARIDWRLQIPEARRRLLRRWMLAVAAATFAVVVLGGITRLTQSGLSIVDWDPILGVVPPLSEAQWVGAFERYRQFPEYQVRRGMTLAEFRAIYWWEYLHRLAARGIGLVFLVPFLAFLARGFLTRALAWRTGVLFALGALQGLMGWLMVRSGLVDQPAVSHYRLAAHLLLAFVIAGYCVWLACDLRQAAEREQPPRAALKTMRRGVPAIGVLLGLQIVWGALVAGLKAGHVFNTFPLMAGGFVPPNLLWLEPAAINFVENASAVQWVHRVLGTALLLGAGMLHLGLVRTRADRRSRRLSLGLLGLTGGQYLLGVATLVLGVPIALAVTHQAVALLLTGLWVVWAHHVRNASPIAGAVDAQAGAMHRAHHARISVSAGAPRSPGAPPSPAPRWP